MYKSSKTNLIEQQNLRVHFTYNFRSYPFIRPMFIILSIIRYIFVKFPVKEEIFSVQYIVNMENRISLCNSTNSTTMVTKLKKQHTKLVYEHASDWQKFSHYWNSLLLRRVQFLMWQLGVFTKIEEKLDIVFGLSTTPFFKRSV